MSESLNKTFIRPLLSQLSDNGRNCGLARLERHRLRPDGAGNGSSVISFRELTFNFFNKRCRTIHERSSSFIEEGLFHAFTSPFPFLLSPRRCSIYSLFAAHENLPERAIKSFAHFSNRRCVEGACGKTWRKSSKLELTEDAKARWQSIDTLTSTSMRRITRLCDAVSTLLHLDS